MRSDLFGKVMTGKRFSEIKAALRCWHEDMYPEEPKPGEPDYHRMLKVRAMYDSILAASRHFFNLGRTVSLDEMMVACRCK